MNSWWSLGEGAGQLGTDLALYQIECSFCNERGKWERAFHAEKKKPNGDKRINFDTFQCGSCAGYVQVLWSASEYGGRTGLHAFHLQPWPLSVGTAPDYWPEDVGRCWKQAQANIQSESWDAAAVMARAALQAAFREKGAKGSNLHKEIVDLASKGILPPLIADWSHEVRALGADAAHPDGSAVSPNDARDVVEFLNYLLRYLYDLPKSITDYRSRRLSSEE